MKKKNEEIRQGEIIRMNAERLRAIARPEKETVKRREAKEIADADFLTTAFNIAMQMRRGMRLAGINQLQLAEMMEVDPSVVSRYMRGKSNMELKTLVKIEKALGINIIDREIAPKRKKTDLSEMQLKVEIQISYQESHVDEVVIPKDSFIPGIPEGYKSIARMGRDSFITTGMESVKLKKEMA